VVSRRCSGDDLPVYRECSGDDLLVYGSTLLHIPSGHSLPLYRLFPAEFLPVLLATPCSILPPSMPAPRSRVRS